MPRKRISFRTLKFRLRSLMRARTIRLHGKVIHIDRNILSPVIVRSLYKGSYAEPEINGVRKVLRPGDRVLEIGTGIGLVAMICADIVGDANVLCFEANPEIIPLAQRNFAVNGHAITLNHAVPVSAPGEHGATREFFLDDNFYSSSLIEAPGRRSVAVPARAITEILDSFDPTAMVVDIEGGEVELLCGITDFRQVGKIIMETHAKYAGQEQIDRMIRHLVDQSGFRLDRSVSEGENLSFRSS